MEKYIHLINAENIELHEDELKKKIEEIQLFFADQKFKQQKEGNVNFSEILLEYTDLCSWIVDEYKRRKKKDDQKIENVTIDGELDELKDEVDKIYNKKQINWQTEIIEAIKREEKKLGTKNEYEGEKKRAGIFYFGIKREITDLQELGVDSVDECVEVHLEEVFKQAGKTVSSAEIKRSLSDLAEKIVKEYPAARAIMGISWLMAHPLAKRLGFMILPERDVPQNQANVWLQLVDENGQIDKKRLNKLLETNEFLYKNTFGIIKVEDFLQRYLPTQYKNKEVVLLEIDPEWAKKYKKLEIAIKQFRDQWDNLTSKEVKGFLIKFPEVKELLDNEVGQEYISMMERMKEDNLSLEDIKTKNKGEAERVGARIQELINKGKYIEKKILIV